MSFLSLSICYIWAESCAVFFEWPRLLECCLIRVVNLKKFESDQTFYTLNDSLPQRSLLARRLLLLLIPSRRPPQRLAKATLSLRALLATMVSVNTSNPSVMSLVSSSGPLIFVSNAKSVSSGLVSRFLLPSTNSLTPWMPTPLLSF